MRKQMKIAAVVSAAALLALGASITSFAASKGTWKYEDGEWYCYDKDGYVYENTFCLSNGKEFYVGDDGAMVRSSWVDDGDSWYFVNSAGQKITNDWRLTTPYDDENAEEQWFYFQSNGKMATNKKLTIKGKTYFFDTDGKMLTGWVQKSGEDYIEATDAGVDDTYYCDETGARLTGAWVWDYAPGVEEDDTDEEEHWFFLKSNGKIQTGKASNIKGQTYFFDEEGKMLTGWVVETQSNVDADETRYISIENSEDADPDYKLSEVGGKVYYCTPEDGHVKKNKWIKLWKPADAYDEDEDKAKKWYYLNKSGEVYIPSSSNPDDAMRGSKYSFEDGQLKADDDNTNFIIEEKKINGKEYLFNANGEMLSGFLKYDGGMHYLGGSNDGIVKTGSQTIKDDLDESYRFYFETKGDDKGKGVTGNKSNKLYYDGMLIKAEDYRYEIAEIDNKWYIVNQSGSIQGRKTEYKEDGDVLIDCREAAFADDDSIAEGSVDASKTNVIDAEEYVYNEK